MIRVGGCTGDGGDTLVNSRASPHVCRNSSTFSPPKKILLSVQSAAEIICAISFLQPACERKAGSNILAKSRLCRRISQLDVGDNVHSSKQTILENLSDPPIKRNSLDRKTKGISKRLANKPIKSQATALTHCIETMVDDKYIVDKVRSAYSSRGSSGVAILGACHHCGETESPQWRKGPPDKPHLCNACGTRFLRKGSLQHSSARKVGVQSSPDEIVPKMV